MTEFLLALVMLHYLLFHTVSFIANQSQKYLSRGLIFL
jgi:hypothetical protein